MTDALILDRVCKNFARTDAESAGVREVSLHLTQGEFFTILGPSGCGKTTLLRLIAGFEVPDSGRIILNGQDMTEKPAQARPVNTVFQHYALFPHMTVAENIGFGLKMRGEPTASRRERTLAAMQMVRLDGMGDRLPAALSGGQQQRVALARALVNRPQVLLLDEPLSALDRSLRIDMQAELKRLQRETGITFVFVTHDQDEALSMSDRVAIMNDGRVIQAGTPQELYTQPATRFAATFLGTCSHVAASALGMTGDDLFFRPEDATLIAIDTHAPLSVTGTIAQLHYHGAVTRYLVALDSGETIIATHATRAWAQGARVRVTIAAEKIFRLPHDDTGSAA